MPPIVLLCILLAITIAAVFINRWQHQRHHAAFRRLALEHRMHYSPRDPLRLTPRVAAHIPVPGASAVRVIDLLYRTDELNHYYVFTAEYTTGVIGPKHRHRQAASFVESKMQSVDPQPMQLAAEHLPLIEQYEALLKTNRSAPGRALLAGEGSQAGSPIHEKDPLTG